MATSDMPRRAIFFCSYLGGHLNSMNHQSLLHGEGRYKLRRAVRALDFAEVLLRKNWILLELNQSSIFLLESRLKILCRHVLNLKLFQQSQILETWATGERPCRLSVLLSTSFFRSHWYQHLAPSTPQA
jgi:hypothetical protein